MKYQQLWSRFKTLVVQQRAEVDRQYLEQLRQDPFNETALAFLEGQTAVWMQLLEFVEREEQLTK